MKDASAAKVRNTVELPVPDTYEFDRPKKTEYETDVLVVGGGYAGLSAAYSARLEGTEVLLLDKARPGYGGQAPWPGTINYFDPEVDDPFLYKEFCRHAGEFFANLDWIDVFMKESKAMVERMDTWGIIDLYPAMYQTEYWENRDYIGYRDNVVGKHERRRKFVEVLNKAGIPWLQHVMVNKLIIQNGRCVGAVGFQFTTGEIITVHAKAVVLAAGNGCVIPTGHPLGGNTFDGEWMAYQVGLPIGGKEFEDTHRHQSFASGNHWVGSDARYFDPNFLCGGFVTVNGPKPQYSLVQKIKEARETMKHPINPEGMPYLESSAFSMEVPDPEDAMARSVRAKDDPSERRIGKMITPFVAFDAPGGATGMSLHLASGVYCGMDDVEGKTAVPGLWVAGDGMHLTNPGGGNYQLGNGFTACFCSICGDHAGKAAAKYSEDVELEHISAENLKEAVDEIEAPLKLETGFSPMWARDVLQGIMAPYWVQCNKTEETLKAALVQVEYMQKHVAHRLLARNGHYLRMCHEVTHKINACELKLRAQLARTESRGTSFYRDDYPERNDKDWSKYVLLTKGPDGKPVLSFEDIKEEWSEAGVPAELKDYLISKGVE